VAAGALDARIGWTESFNKWIILSNSIRKTYSQSRRPILLLETTSRPDPGPLNVHLQQLAYLRAVEAAPTWSEAARRLHVSQPALSQSLAELERRLGVALFERAGRRRVLTPEGEEAAAFARRVLAEAHDLRERLHAGRAGVEGRLRVGMIDAASLYVLPRAVRSFRVSHPRVRLELTVASSGVLRAMLEAFELDIAFVTGPAGETAPGDVEVFQEPLYLYGPPGDRRRAHEAEWVLYPPGSRTRRQIDAALARQGIAPNVILESGNPQVLRQMVALGFGWSVLPAAVAESPPEPLRRRGKSIARRSLLAVRRPDAPPDARAEAFLRLAARARRGRKGLPRSR
jgi:DNA-binding transcriptional LysR family regulator